MYASLCYTSYWIGKWRDTQINKQFSETSFRYFSCRSHFPFHVSFISFSWQQHVQTQISNPISNPLIHLFPLRKQSFLSNDPLLPPFSHFRERHFFYICPCILPEQISCGGFSVRKPWQVGNLPCLRVAQALWDTGRRADGHAYREHQCTQLIALNTRAVLIVHKYYRLSATCFDSSVPTSGSTACKVWK